MRRLEIEIYGRPQRHMVLTESVLKRIVARLRAEADEMGGGRKRTVHTARTKYLDLFGELEKRVEKYEALRDLKSEEIRSTEKAVGQPYDVQLARAEMKLVSAVEDLREYQAEMAASGKKVGVNGASSFSAVRDLDQVPEAELKLRRKLLNRWKALDKAQDRDGSSLEIDQIVEELSESFERTGGK